ncbi:MAG: hypothetical protein II249_03330 [Bacteroidaceae bacterium]|nr:hypothetical protein [Bacteroidaceae bacterium]
MDKSEIELKKFGMTNNINGEKTLDISLKINSKVSDWLKDVAMIRCDISESEAEELAKQLADLPIQIEKELDSMDNFEKIEITFKSGETISYGKDEWDDYAFDGKAVIVKKNGAWIGIYNFDDVFCVELKEN